MAASIGPYGAGAIHQFAIFVRESVADHPELSAPDAEVFKRFAVFLENELAPAARAVEWFLSDSCGSAQPLNLIKSLLLSKRH